MSVNEKNIIDFKTGYRKDKAAPFSSGFYNWTMFLINFYGRVKNTLKIDFDSFMIMQIVVSDYLYNSNKESKKNYSINFYKKCSFFCWRIWINVQLKRRFKKV